MYSGYMDDIASNEEGIEGKQDERGTGWVIDTKTHPKKKPPPPNLMLQQ
jgi:hypothetical protein